MRKLILFGIVLLLMVSLVLAQPHPNAKAQEKANENAVFKGGNPIAREHANENSPLSEVIDRQICLDTVEEILANPSLNFCSRYNEICGYTQYGWTCVIDMETYPNAWHPEDGWIIGFGTYSWAYYPDDWVEWPYGTELYYLTNPATMPYTYCPYCFVCGFSGYDICT